ncbi:MAG: epoxyqueuosine reductase QueH [Campylobacterota bacterium]|nr:epoxyqueuosine reductase QueH [Campylobacterota bacterium]
MLIHICCSVDSHYFLQRIKKDYPTENLVGFFYDPNIHPYSEYKLRYLDVKYSCNKLGIKLIEGSYDLENWLNIVKGFENEPEKGDRCDICFYRRLEVTVEKAIELNHNKFTTTLLISPKKSQDKLLNIGKELEKEYNCEFIFKDYRSGNGVEMQGKEVKKNNLYRQNYCGCMFALNAQRLSKEKLADELISPINKQILPSSIEARLELYKKRDSLEKFNIIKERFLNYRLLNAKLFINKEIVNSYFLPYSTLKNKKSNGRIEKSIDDIYYFNRDEIKIVTLKYLNNFLKTNYKNILELIYNPPKFEDELKLRDKITKSNFYDLSTIIILEEISKNKIEIFINYHIYDDVKERLI